MRLGSIHLARQDANLVKLVTYNLHKGRSSLRRNTMARIAAALAELAPDLLFCQELFEDRRKQENSCKLLAEALEHGHAFGPNAFYRRGCHGNATFSRLRLATHRNVDISQSQLERRGILHTSLDDEQGRIETFNLHFSLTRRQRRKQWRQLRDCLPEHSKVPVIIAGDFNDWSGEIDRQARRAGLIENALWGLAPRQRHSFPAKHPIFALDRVYLRGFEVLSARVLRGRPWSALSDHLPIEVELERKP